MTPEILRAERIIGILRTMEGTETEIAKVVAEIKAAVEEERNQNMIYARVQNRLGQVQAYEDAAKIADSLFHEAGNMSVDASRPALSFINERMRIARDLASAIRARARGVKT